MSRWIHPGSFEARFREREVEQRFERIEKVMEVRRQEAARTKQIVVVEDHDPGDEHRG